MNDNPTTLPYTLRDPDTCPPKRQTEGAAGYLHALDVAEQWLKEALQIKDD